MERMQRFYAMSNTLMRPSEIAQVLRCGKSKVYMLMKQPSFPTIKVNGSLRCYRYDLLDWIEAQRLQQPYIADHRHN